MNEIRTPDRSLGGLFSELTQETTTLFRQEISLAKAEMTEKVRQAGAGIAALAAGAVLLLIAAQALVAAAILGLATTLAAWLAALIVGAALLLAGGIAVARGVAALRRENLTPRRTLDTQKANTRWAREQMP